MRTDNPLLSPGYFAPRSRPNQLSSMSEPSPGAPSPPTRLLEFKRRHSILKPVHKRQPIPRLFRPFHSHRQLPINISQTRLSRKAINSVNFALHHGWADATLKNYGGAVDRFLAFCTSEGVPEELQLPADEFVLCAFAASSAGIHAGSTVRNDIAGVKAWHIAQGADWNGSSRLHYVLSGVENLTPESSKRPPRPPINAAMLSMLYEGLNLSSPADIAVFAAACVAFWGQCRLGEILPASMSPSACRYLPTRRNVSAPARAKRATVLHLPRTKTKTRGEDVILVSQTAPLDPRVALEMHLLANRCGDDLPLFTYQASGSVTILTKPKFLARCNAIWRTHGLPRTTGHSFRIGGTTELLLAGVPPDVVKAMGRWSSDAFHKYWRSLEDLAPRHAEFINSS